MLSVIGVFVLAALASYRSTEAAQSAHWGYEGTHGASSWADLYPECGKARQSPINIDTGATVYDEKLVPIHLAIDLPMDVDPYALRLVNNGHTVNLHEIPAVIRVTGGNLGNTFRVAGVHFHWGQSDQTGSEHTVNGQHFPLEMHMVSYNEDKYDTVGQAAKESDGLAVIGLLFQISPEDNPLLNPLIAKLSEVTEPGHVTNISNYDFTKFFPSNLNNYYRYLGSLTTPPCFESVTWTVLSQVSTVSSSQINAFRALHQHSEEGHAGHAKNLDQNWRPVQPLYNRVVSRSFQLRPEHPIVKGEAPAASPAAGAASSNPVASFVVLLFSALAGFLTRLV